MKKVVYPLPNEDIELFKLMEEQYVSNNEKLFFETMFIKETSQYPVSSFDVIMDEKDNSDGIFIDKCYSSEYKIGRTFRGKTIVLSIHPLSLTEALNCDLFDLINKHISLHSWLRSIDYKGLRYDYNWEE